MKNDLISREYMKSLGATCIASRSKDGNMFPIVSIDELPPAHPDVPDTNVGESISRQVAIDVASRECHEWRGIFSDIEDGLKGLPSAQLKTQKLLDDGTLIVHTNIDITKITRVNITQNNTHYGDLFYRDEE